MSNRSILRIGPIDASNDCNASLLRDAILRHFRDGSPSPVIGATEGSGGHAGQDEGDDYGGDDNLLTVSNRYFDAGVLLLGLRESSRHYHDDAVPPPEEDGVLLVFDDRPPGDDDAGAAARIPAPPPPPFVSFDSLDRIHDEVVATRPPGEDNAPTIGDLLRLCIGTTTAGSDPPTVIDEDEYSRRVLWCLDRGYEYVSVDLSEEGMTTGFDRRDKDGYARVIEAIETCMWSCRVMGGGGGVGRVVSREGGSAGATESVVATMSTATTVATDAKRERAAMASLMNGANGGGGGDDDDHAGVPREDEEVAFHRLEKILTEAKCIREASRNNHLSDEERRTRAGDAAMKLMGLLDQLGFDDDDKDDDDDDDGSDDSGIKEVTGR